jgi:hypothetical protein
MRGNGETWKMGEGRKVEENQSENEMWKNVVGMQWRNGGGVWQGRMVGESVWVVLGCAEVGGEGYGVTGKLGGEREM